MIRLTLIAFFLSTAAGASTRQTGHVLQDPLLFQGDMILSPAARKSLSSDENYEDSVANTMLWPDATIRYQLSLGREDGLAALVHRAMAHIEKRTCVRFIERNKFTDFFFGRPDYINLFRGKGCYSVVGRYGGQQPLSLGPGCENLAIIVHELLHAIGLFHKHSRHDRDQYLQIHWHNIDPDMWSQFEKLPEDPNEISTSDMPFDYKSVMLYGDRTFSRDEISITMSRKDGGKLMDVMFKSGMSKHDISIVNQMYRCHQIKPLDDKKLADLENDLDHEYEEAIMNQRLHPLRH